jgi:hypothetical protein
MRKFPQIISDRYSFWLIKPAQMPMNPSLDATKRKLPIFLSVVQAAKMGMTGLAEQACYNDFII